MSMVSWSSLLTRSSGARLSTCGRASLNPGTRMNAYVNTVGSSGWVTRNGMIWLLSLIVTSIFLSLVTRAEAA